MPFFHRHSAKEKTPKVEDFYEIGEELGRGTFSVVRKAKHKQTGKLHALKIIDRKTVGDKQEMLETEVAILRKVKHPGIITMSEIFETDRKLYLVMELVTGGELFDKIVERGSYSEADARNCTQQILEAILYLHNEGIVHRDLKPENLLYATNSVDADIKISDFGLSKIVDDDMMLKTACGTPGYVAPEVLKCQGYGAAVDIWSVGVIVYILLCGFPPFYEENTALLFEQIMAGRFDFPAPYWTNISDSAKDLIRKMLVVDPAKRLSAQEALDHPWLRGGGHSSDHLDSVVVELRRFNARRKFKMAIHGVLAGVKLAGAAGGVTTSQGSDK